MVGPLPEGVELPDTDYDPGKERRAAVAHLEETYETARRELGRRPPPSRAGRRRSSRRRARRASCRRVQFPARRTGGEFTPSPRRPLRTTRPPTQASVSATVLRSDAAGRPRLARGSRSVRAMRMAWIV